MRSALTATEEIDMKIESIEKDWNLCILEYGETSPLENHGAFELAVDNTGHRIYGSEVFIRAMGMDSILSACRSYMHKIGVI